MMVAIIQKNRGRFVSLSLALAIGCSGSQGYNTVARPAGESDIAQAPQTSSPAVVVQQQTPQLQAPQSRQPVQPIATVRRPTNGTVRLVGHTEPQHKVIQRAAASHPQHVAPPISALHLTQMEKDRRSIGTKPETPVLILTTLPPKAEGDVAVLLSQVRSGDAATCREAIYQLGRRGEDAIAAAPTLTVMLRDRDHLIRVQAALALWRITQQAEFSVPTLADAINFSTPRAKSFAAVALAEMGPAAREAIPALKIAARKNSGKIRVQAAEALWTVAEGNRDALETMALALRDDDPEVRWAAAYALGDIAPKNPMIVDALARRLRDVNDGVRVAAAFALGEIGPSAKDAETVLTAAASDPNQEVRQAAAVALDRVRD
ncbi:HEAT repeat domain-containing protein [Symmachiella dynata]|nr:HEAT repeat domain-containing protein [Symmachiella dynata]